MRSIREYLIRPENMTYVPKGWGWERWIWNGEYCGKILHINDGKKCSWHYHKNKDEVMLILQGQILMRYGWDHNIEKADEIILNVGDAFHVVPGLVHQMQAVGGDAELSEYSTHHEDSDSYRVIKGD